MCTEYWDGSKWVIKLPNSFKDKLVKARQVPVTYQKDGKTFLKVKQ